MTTTNEGTQRDELADEIAGRPIGSGYESTSVGMDEAREMASAILAAGYRKPRTITTVEERDALREGSVVRDKDGDVIERLWGGWYFGDNNTVPNLPATVLWEPEVEVGA